MSAYSFGLNTYTHTHSEGFTLPAHMHILDFFCALEGEENGGKKIQISFLLKLGFYLDRRIQLWFLQR